MRRSGLAQEIELKLELAADAVDALLRSDLLPGDPKIAELRSTYFDTPGEDLRAAGFSLRIRRSGNKRVQTVKAAGTSTAGLFARPEWEKPVESDSPVLDDTTPIKALLGGVQADLGPAFEILVERRAWTVSAEDAAIELALDRGEVIAGDRRSPLCEIELELKHGSPGALFSLTRRIDAVAPLRIGVLSKAERGYRLLGAAVRAAKSEPVVLAKDMTAGDAFQAIAGACLRHFRLNEMLVDRFNGEALHQIRVALRRLRSAFVIHKAMLQDEAFGRLREELRWLAAEFGPARDLDVLIARNDVESIRPRLEQARHEAYDRAEAALASPRTRALMLDLSEWLAVGVWRSSLRGSALAEQPAREFAASALDRLRRRVKKGGRGLARLDDEARHEVRKDAKKLRYAAEFFASLFSEKHRQRRHKRFIEALELLQDKLGALNDMASVPGMLSRVGLDKDPAAEALLDAAGEKNAAMEAAAEAHEAFADAKPFWR